jgi:hypothetical protein
MNYRKTVPVRFLRTKLWAVCDRKEEWQQLATFGNN